MWVRLQNNIVCEILPENAAIPSVAYWYGDDFAAQCIQAPENITQGMVYNAETEEFIMPDKPQTTVQETTENLTLDMLADHEYRLSLLELGIE